MADHRRPAAHTVDRGGHAHALPEYPRPQLTRDRWANLNGVWEFAGAAEGEDPPFGETLAEEILVPYPTESELSGTVAADDVGDADATLTGTTWTDGVAGGGLSFDGAGEADTGRTLVRTDGSYSISAWAKLDVADGAFQMVVSQDTGGKRGGPPAGRRRRCPGLRPGAVRRRGGGARGGLTPVRAWRRR